MLGVIPIMVDILSGEIWTKDEAEIASAQKSLSNVLTGLKSVGKAFDERLVTLKTDTNLKSVEFFRKPRESKKDNTVSLESVFGAE